MTQNSSRGLKNDSNTNCSKSKDPQSFYNKTQSDRENMKRINMSVFNVNPFMCLPDTTLKLILVKSKKNQSLCLNCF